MPITQKTTSWVGQPSAAAISGTVSGPSCEDGQDLGPHDGLLADDLAEIAVRGVHATGTSRRLSIIAVIWASV